MAAISRRSFLAAPALAAGYAAFIRPAEAAAPKNDAQGPGAYRYKLGDYQLTALYDGTWYLPIDEHFVRNASGAAVNEALATAFLPPSVLPITFTALLVNTGAKLILIDTGTAGQITDTAGFMNGNLAAAGDQASRHRHHRHLAFPSRPHRRHQDQGRRQGVYQCRDPGAGAGVELLDGRRAHDRHVEIGARLFPQRETYLCRHRQARCDASSPAPRWRPASSRSPLTGTRRATPPSPSTPAINRCW